jgi:hypothetical protein
MSQDIDQALRDWEFKPGIIQARLIDVGVAPDTRQVIQMRLDLGILQMETTGRPDGVTPNGCPTYFDYLQRLAAKANRSKAKREFQLTEEQCLEADREFMQFYHRRICWLALREYERAVQDADHTLAFMTFVKDHSPNEEYTEQHEVYRAFVLFHRTQALAALRMDHKDPEGAVDAVNQGLESIRLFFEENGLDERWNEDAMVQELKKMQDRIRDMHNIDATLQEQLELAISREEYETAARLRDAIRKRQTKSDQLM